MAGRNIYRRKSNQKVIGIAIAVVAFLLIVVQISSSSLKAKNEDYLQQQQELQAKIDSEKQRTEELEQYEQYVQSDEFVEWAARNKLGLVNSDELILKRN